MTIHATFASLAIGLPLLALAGFTSDVQQSVGGADAEYIARAMTAAPPNVAHDATIVRMADGTVQTLKVGANQFTCMVANTGPMCMAPIATAWVLAWQTHAPPPDKLGFIYALNGDTGASNTDPWATKPAPDNHWVETGPYVMMVGLPVKKMSFPRAPDPDSTYPYVRWSGTPYEHVVIPLNPANRKLAAVLRDVAGVLTEAASNVSDPSLIQVIGEMRADAKVLLGNLSKMAP
jgi:hypothetical protein